MPVPHSSKPSLVESRTATVGAWLVVAAMLLQFLFAGLAAFQDATKWACHEVLGFVIGGLLLGLALVTALTRQFPLLRGWLMALGLAYGVQVGLIRLADTHGITLARALHPFNGSLLLVLAVILALKLSPSLHMSRNP